MDTPEQERATIRTDGRIVCPNCQYANGPRRTTCKQCQQPLNVPAAFYDGQTVAPAMPEVTTQQVEFPKVQRVIVTDIHMSFMSMVVFIVKWTIAAIPALLILFIIGFLAVAFSSAMLAN